VERGELAGDRKAVRFVEINFAGQVPSLPSSLPLLQDQFGNIDIYLFDQLLRGRIAPGMRIVDAGCGYGRNLVYLLREGYEIFGADADPRAIDGVRRLGAHLPANNFRVEPIEAMSFPDAFSDVVLSSAVLHFARDDDHF
jgi:tellurite methyltransferase